MTTLVARTLLALILLLQIPLSGEVFAQVETPETSTTSANTDEAVVTPPPANPARWYKSEKIFGRVEVGDFVVGPGRAELTARPGETITTEVSVTNRISSDREFKLEVEDVVGTQDGKSMRAMPPGERSETSLIDLISFPDDSLTLDLGERARIPVTISVPPNAAPGGYFGAVLVSTVRVNEDQAQAARSPIIARVASLIFLTVEGEVEEGGEALSLDTLNQRGWWYESGPIEFGLLFENTGTIHSNPYGEVSIRNILGEEVGYIILEPWFVLPKSLRLREFDWDREFLFGRYTVEAQINRGWRNDEDVVDVLTTSFWVLPWRLVGSIFLALFIIIFAIRLFFRKFEFKRKDS
jgi:hypothetical protein